MILIVIENIKNKIIIDKYLEPTIMGSNYLFELERMALYRLSYDQSFNLSFQLIPTDFNNNYIQDIKNTISRVKDRIKKYNLIVNLEESHVDLHHTICSDLAYSINEDLLIGERIFSINEELKFDKIIFINTKKFKILRRSLKRLGLPVKVYHKRHIPNLIIFKEKWVFLLKYLYLKFALFRVQKGKQRYFDNNKHILFEIGTKYYFDKISKYFDRFFNQSFHSEFLVLGRSQIFRTELIQLKTLYNFRSILVKVKNIHLDNVSNNDLLELLILNKLCSLYIRAQLYFDSCYRYFNSEKCDYLIVTFSSKLFVSCLISSAKLFKIPVALLNGGAFTIPEQFLLTKVNKYFVWGNYDKEKLQKYGISEKDIQLIGSPFFPSIDYGVTVSPKSDLLKIGIATGGFPTEYNWYFWRTLSDAISLLNPVEIKIMIRLHPNEKITNVFVDDFTRNSNFTIEYDTSKNTNRFLTQNNLIVHQNSTLGIESIIAGTPAIDIDFTGSNSNAPWDCFTIPVKAKNSDELLNAIRFYQDNNSWGDKFISERKEFITNMFCCTSEKAFENFTHHLITHL
ncbi:MAG: hypothetical protein Q8M94_19305 [Ignavibacteria bacterium]|nr:hypothetical protein [Ignavibacteria bacterium]